MENANASVMSPVIFYFLFNYIPKANPGNIAAVKSPLVYGRVADHKSIGSVQGDTSSMLSKTGV